jgi:O-acetyl-ADP-ribose deacetylase (regulator of RNase III)
VRHHQPAYTSAGRLPFRYILHAVGPVWGDGGEDEKLRAAVLGSLALAERLQLSSLALPAISTGIFGFPKERAGRVILPAVHGYLGENPAGSLRRVRITLFDAPTLEAFTRAWDQSFPPAP